MAKIKKFAKLITKGVRKILRVNDKEIEMNSALVTRKGVRVSAKIASIIVNESITGIIPISVNQTVRVEYPTPINNETVACYLYKDTVAINPLQLIKIPGNFTQLNLVGTDLGALGLTVDLLVLSEVQEPTTEEVLYEERP